MELLHTDFKKGIVKLKITDPDDLWYLSHLIEPGDKVTGKTTRKIKIGESERAKLVKKTLTLTLEVEKMEYSPAELRINGKVQTGPEEVPKGSYHTLSAELDSELTLSKQTWLTYQKQKLQEAVETKYTYLLCLFDREEALFALTKKKGFELLVKLKGEVPKKNKSVEIKKDFYQEIINWLEEYSQRYHPERIIVASPAFWKEELYKRISSVQLKHQIVLATCSEVDENALPEVLKRPELAAILKTSRARQEKILMDEVLSAINKQGPVAYGWKEVKKAMEAGAVRILLLTDTFVQHAREQGTFAETDAAMRTVDQLEGAIHILSSEGDEGRKLDGLGGVAALLRYKLEW